MQRTAVNTLLRQVAQVARSSGSSSLPIAITKRSFSSSLPSRSEQLAVHRNSAHNNASIKFEFTPANMKIAQEIISRYPSQYKKAAVIPLLELGQIQNKGWTSLSVMDYISKLLEMPQMRVYEVATFYTMFNREPVGEHFVQICTTTPCMLGGCGSDSIVKTITSHLGIGLGQTTKDNKFTVIEVECLGACSNAPMVQINDKFYEDLTPESTIKVLDALAAGQQPATGPQSARKGCEANGSRTALTEEPPTTDQFCTPEWR